MPLFGSKHHSHATPATQPPSAYGQTEGVGAGRHNAHHYEGTGANVPAPEAYPTHHSATTGHHDAYGTTGNTLSSSNPRHHNNATGAGYEHETSIPPSRHIDSTTATTGHHHGATGTASHGGSSTTGKMERAMGALVGSRSLKEKGMEKEREAQAFKVQSAELAEAERLEGEAKVRRERAVAHGAHPQNQHLGGAEPSSGFGREF